MKALGNRIKEERLRNGFTLDEVAEKVNISKASLSKLENGLIQNPKRALIDDLANLFGCDPKYLLGYQHSDDVMITYHSPGKEPVTLLVDGKPIVGEVGKRAKLYKAALSVAPENIDVAIELLRSLAKGSDYDA